MSSAPLKRCFREPIPEIFEAARNLDAAVTAHLGGDRTLAAELFVRANNPLIWEWTDSIWGKKSRFVSVTKTHGAIAKAKVPLRMPTSDLRQQLLKRDGYHCRFCGLPVIRPEIRRRIVKAYPREVPWGRTNYSQHAAFQAMWAQYDHVVPHSHGGTNDADNLVVTCAPCNYGKMAYTIEQLGLLDPRLSEPVASSSWDGLERFR